jgi:hypothetical protein
MKSKINDKYESYKLLTSTPFLECQPEHAPKSCIISERLSRAEVELFTTTKGFI